MARGDHIITPMVAYSHHGIDVGDGTVVLILNVPAVLQRLSRSVPLGAIA